MPRNVRNFWIETTVDGRKSKIATGPRRKGGGFNIVVRVREKGQISNETLKIEGISDEEMNGLKITFPDGHQEHMFFER
jgi:hypothetical protein